MLEQPALERDGSAGARDEIVGVLGDRLCCLLVIAREHTDLDAFALEVTNHPRRLRTRLSPIGERMLNRDYIGSELTTGELMLLDALGSDADSRRPGETLRDPPDDDIYCVAREQTRNRD